LSEEYPEADVAHGCDVKATYHYGVYKQANEGNARVYWLENGLSSIGLRPYIVYGPGRDQGLTAGPTKAMLAAALGRQYHIPFGGLSTYQYVEDVARAFIRAARVPFEGAGVYNMGGTVVHVREIIGAIENAEPAMAGQITFDDHPLPFPERYADAMLHSAIGPLQGTPLKTGVEETIKIFKQAIASGRLDPDKGW
jgi:nucleoside-diphosphate-sugar epimerase